MYLRDRASINNNYVSQYHSVIQQACIYIVVVMVVKGRPRARFEHVFAFGSRRDLFLLLNPSGAFTN